MTQQWKFCSESACKRLCPWNVALSGSLSRLKMSMQGCMSYFFHACSKDTIWEFSLVITNTPHRHNYTLYAAWRNHLWSASITKSSRGPPCKTTKCFTRRKETRRVDVHRYKDLDSSSHDLRLFPSIIVLCLKSLITSIITGTEHNNAQSRITPWTVLTFPHPVAMFDLIIQIT